MGLFEKKFVGLDFHDHSAQVVEIHSKGKNATLKAFNRKRLDTGVMNNGEIVREQELKTALSELFQQANPHSIFEKNVAIVFPASKILSHTFAFPASLKEKEIRKALPFEVEKTIPFSIEDVYWDFTVLYKEKPPKQPKEKTKDKKKPEGRQFVLFSAIIKKTADHYTEILQSIGIIPSVFGIQAEAIKEVLDKYINSTEATLVIDIGALSVNFLILKDKEIKHFSSLNDGGYQLIKQLAKDYNTSEDFLVKEKEGTNFHTLKTDTELAQKEKKDQRSDIKKFFKDIYTIARKIMLKKEKIPEIGNIKTVVLSGEYLNLPGYNKIAEKFFPKRTIQTIKAEKALNIKAQNFSKKGKTFTPPPSTYFTNSIGIALKAIRNINSPINLLPKPLKDSLYKKRNTLIMTYLGVFMALLGIVVSILMATQYSKAIVERQEYDDLKTSLENTISASRFQEIRKRIADFNFEINILSQIETTLFSVENTITTIEQAIPQKIKITTLEFRREDDSISFSGIAPNREDIIEVKDNLREIPFIQDVIAPISNFDTKSNISFVMKIILDPSNLPPYATQITEQS